MKQKTDYTLLAVALVIACAGCYNSSVVAPKRRLLEMGYNTKIDERKAPQHITGYTIDAVYIDGRDTVSVKGLSQYQYDSLKISE